MTPNRLNLTNRLRHMQQEMLEAKDQEHPVLLYEPKIGDGSFGSLVPFQTCSFSLD
jgi:hypothetical protein